MPANLVFGAPWILLGLLALPVLWWLLRMLPPKPIQTYFPALFLLKPLLSREETPHQQPWWWLLLRMLLLALVIIAAADPRWQRALDTPPAPLIMVIDNSWANALDWRAVQEHALNALEEALDQQQDVTILLSTPPAQGERQIRSTEQAPPALRRFIQSLSPLPWPKDEAALLALLPERRKHRILWYSDGLKTIQTKELRAALANIGEITWLGNKRPFPTIVTSSKQQGGTLSLTLAQLHGAPSPATITFFDEQDATLLETPLVATEDGWTATLPRPYWKTIRSFRVGEDKRLGAFVLSEPLWSGGVVGIINHTTDSDSVLAASYFVRNAVATFADYQLGSAETLAAQDGGLIVLPHDTPLAEADTQNLLSWVQRGGVLIRFAGETLASAAADDRLLPVALRAGIRQFEGNLTWEKAPSVTSINPDSPLAGLSIPPDIEVKRQILAAPNLDLPARTWLSLSDGTPLITGRTEGDGWLILVHTTANPAWSSFAYSGLFIDVLERGQQLSLGQARPNTDANAESLTPFAILDAYGRRLPPPDTVTPLPLASPSLSPQTPPGLYGTGGGYAFNFGAHLPDLAPIDTALTPLEDTAQLILWPYLLAAALLLWCLDYLLVVRLLILATFLLLSLSAQAASYADQGRLAFIRSGDAALDATTASGLANLTTILSARTSVEFDTPLGLTFDDPRLPLMPLLYWPLPVTPISLTQAEKDGLSDYLTQQGILVIDTRQGFNPLALQQAEQAVATLLRQLPVRPLTRLPQEHVLHRTFYVLPQLTGRYDGQPLYIEQSDSQPGFVSRVILTHHALAEGLASTSSDARQLEMAYRSGVNIVLYALTGTYKDDQVHVETLLQQIGR